MRTTNEITIDSQPKQQVIVDDCVKFMASMDSESIDVVITSPPYNLGIKYSSYLDTRNREEYKRWIRDVFWRIEGIMKPGAHFFLNFGDSCIDPWISMDVAGIASETFSLQNHIIWVKSISIGEETHGHFKPINSERFLNNNWENIFHFTKWGNAPIDRLSIGVPYKDKSNLNRGTRGKNGDIRCAGNVWFIPYDTIQSSEEKGNHPAIFPEELVSRCLLLAGATPDSLILDPFLGSGTTLVVCKKLGLPGIGIEVDPKYAAYSIRRIENAE